MPRRRAPPPREAVQRPAEHMLFSVEHRHSNEQKAAGTASEGLFAGRAQTGRLVSKSARLHVQQRIGLGCRCLGLTSGLSLCDALTLLGSEVAKDVALSASPAKVPFVAHDGCSVRSLSVVALSLALIGQGYQPSLTRAALQELQASSQKARFVSELLIAQLERRHQTNNSSKN